MWPILFIHRTGRILPSTKTWPVVAAGWRSRSWTILCQPWQVTEWLQVDILVTTKMDILLFYRRCVTTALMFSMVIYITMIVQDTPLHLQMRPSEYDLVWYIHSWFWHFRWVLLMTISRLWLCRWIILRYIYWILYLLMNSTCLWLIPLLSRCRCGRSHFQRTGVTALLAT